MPHQYEDTNHGSVIDVTFFFDRAVLRLLFSKSFDFSDLLSQTLVNDFFDLQILTTSLIFCFFICLSSILRSSPVSHSPLEVGLKVIVEIANNSQTTTKVFIESYYKHLKHAMPFLNKSNSILFSECPLVIYVSLLTFDHPCSKRS